MYSLKGKAWLSHLVDRPCTYKLMHDESFVLRLYAFCSFGRDGEQVNLRIIQFWILFFLSIFLSLFLFTGKAINMFWSVEVVVDPSHPRRT